VTYKDLAEKYNLTIEQVQRESYDFLQNEGYDKNGNEHEKIDSWLCREKMQNKSYEPIHKEDIVDFSWFWS
jgi:hypothetical protein